MKLSLALLLFAGMAFSYKIISYYTDDNCENDWTEMYDDGTLNSGKCYEVINLLLIKVYTKARCKGGVVDWNTNTGGGDCEDRWKSDEEEEEQEEEEEEEEEDDDEGSCNGKCCDVFGGSIKCYCKKYGQVDAMMITAFVLMVIPCCWVGCIIFWQITFVVWLCCGCGPCLQNL